MPEQEHKVEVLVCGGGIAGIAAAIAAARAGMKTALVEKTIFTGGLATTGMVNIYLPICDGCGRQVTFGLAEEFLHRSLRYGPGEAPDWQASCGKAGDPRYRVVFSPASFILALDEMLEESGVELWLDALACAPIMEGRRVAGVEIEGKEGRVRLLADCTIDATGDADIAFRAGVPCHKGRNALTIWGMEFNERAENSVALDARKPGRIAMIRYGGHSAAATETSTWRADSAHEVTKFVLESRRLLREHYAKLYASNDASRQELFPVTLPAMAQFRTTRRIAGRSTMHADEHGVQRADSIGLVADWRKSGYVWEVPYGALAPVEVEGLLAVGRCISSEGDAWEITRVIPAAALTGEVAGIAASQAIRAGASPHELPVAPLQAVLRKCWPLHVSDLGSPPNA